MKALSLVSSITGAGVGVAIVSSSARNRADIKRPLRRCRLWCSAKHWDGKGLYFSGAVPGVALLSSGEGLMWPSAFSGVLDRTEVGPGPAVAGLSPRGPEGSTPCFCVLEDLLSTGVPAGGVLVAIVAVLSLL